MRSFVEHIVETTNTSHFKTLTLPEFLFEWAVETLDDAYAPFLGATVQPFPHADLQSYLGRVQSQTKAKGEKYKLPYVHRSNIKDMISIKDEHGVEFDLDKLRALVWSLRKSSLWTASSTRFDQLSHSCLNRCP